MTGAPLIVLTGPPGAGKTTVARLLAGRIESRACVLESDWWWTTITSGWVPPWKREAHDQNRTVVRSFAAAASVMAASGYSTVLEGIVGAWMLDVVLAETDARGVSLLYAVLRPSLEVALDRATGRVGEERVPGHPALTDAAVIEDLWQQFSGLGAYEQHVIDNSSLAPNDTVDALESKIASGVLRLR